ncbi:tRNA pseudouridine(55) synthase TruB [bacterium]|nr:tRNA pseudouridine(55) synthase TruB [bacterium]
MSTDNGNRMPDGFLPVIKPAGPSSATIVNCVKRLTRAQRVGHSGTLDPAAEGVLVLAFHRATRLFPYLLSDKAYRATVRLGEITSTYDARGEVEKTFPIPNLHPAAIVSVLEAFQGDQQQIPPMVSALHHKGKRLYELARRGEVVVREPRSIVIHWIHLLDYHAPDISIEVGCSRGTYIRSLAFDIGQRLGCGAHLHALTRILCNGFSIEQAMSLEQLEAAVQQTTWRDRLIAPEKVLGHLTPWTVAGQVQQAVQHGSAIALPDNLEPGDQEIVRLQDVSGRILALAQKKMGQLKMIKVLHPANEENK